MMDTMADRMIFVIGSPRSGSTMLQRMLSSHPRILGCPEPHMITPLAHLGYYETVEKAPYDHLRAVEAIRGFVAHLPNGEEDYLDACRAYTDTLYGRYLASESKGQDLFLDKTPAYGLVLPFLAKLYPQAFYIVLTRHPVAIFSSYAKSFFDGDYEYANRYNPIINRYVPAIARFLEERPVEHLYHIRYEDLVTEPEPKMREIAEFLGIDYEDAMVNYGNREHDSKGLGDPINVDKLSRPMTKSISKWTKDLAGDEGKQKLVIRIIEALDGRELEIWGYDKKEMLDTLYRGEFGDPPRKKKIKRDRYILERRILLRLRKNIHHNWFGKLCRKIRFACDVLLR